VSNAHSGDNITLSHLELGARILKLNIGHGGERAVAYSQGRSIYNYDLIDVIQKNPILGFAFAAVLVPAFWKWVAKNCFPTPDK
jgi:hypothetical protein